MTTPPRPTLLDVDRLRKGLLTPDEAARVQAGLAAHGDPEAGLRTDAEVFRADPPDLFARRVRAAAVEQPASRRWLWAPVMGLAVAAAALLFVPPPDGPDDIVLKGDRHPAIRVLRGVPGGSLERLRDGDAASAGDTLQLVYEDGGARFGVLLSVDGVGAVTEHHRWTSASDGEVVVPRGYRLDPAPSFEAFHLLLSPTPFDVDAALAAAAAAGRAGPPPPPGGSKVSLTLRKVP
jgi:hypothetical protein